jgi:GGDEF domain-containing protein
MTRLRYSVLSVLITLVLFFNIERLTLGTQELVNIHTFVYLYGTAVVCVVLLYRPISRVGRGALLGAVTALYLILRLTLFRDDPLVGGLNTYVTITELSLLALLAVLAHWCARHLRDFEEAVALITFGDIYRRVPPLEEALEEVQLELARSRRYQSPLSVFVVAPDPVSAQANLHRAIQEVQRTMVRRYVLAGIARVISTVLRRTDLVVEERQHGRFVILSPETPLEGSEVVTERIRRAVIEQLGIGVTIGVATFPDDALTFDELLRKAEGELDAAGAG